MSDSNVLLCTLKVVAAANLDAVTVRATIERARPKRNESCPQHAALDLGAIVLRLRRYVRRPFLQLDQAGLINGILPAHKRRKVFDRTPNHQRP